MAHQDGCGERLVRSPRRAEIRPICLPAEPGIKENRADAAGGAGDGLAPDALKELERFIHACHIVGVLAGFPSLSGRFENRSGRS